MDKIFKTKEEEFALLEKSIYALAQHTSPLEILEAGCGWRWPLTLNNINYTLTGVDISQKTIEIRQETYNDLDKIYVGDIRTITLPENKYDVIYNAFVLEHMTDSEKALENLITWLKPNGLLILRIPDRDSAYGFITRITPFWLHVWYKKYLRGRPNAGKPGYSPYPTIHEKAMAKENIRAFCQQHQAKIIGEYAYAHHLEGKGIVPIITAIFTFTLYLLSLGRLAWQYNNITFLITKDYSSKGLP